jgi:hypothetical protein
LSGFDRLFEFGRGFRITDGAAGYQFDWVAESTGEAGFAVTLVGGGIGDDEADHQAGGKDKTGGKPEDDVAVHMKHCPIDQMAKPTRDVDWLPDPSTARISTETELLVLSGQVPAAYGPIVVE